MNAYIQSFPIVADEIESRIYDAIQSMPDENIFDSLVMLIEQFMLDFPDESTYYRREVIESTFESKAELLTLQACRLSEPRTDYMELADLYDQQAEASQLTLF